MVMQIKLVVVVVVYVDNTQEVFSMESWGLFPNKSLFILSCQLTSYVQICRTDKKDAVGQTYNFYVLVAENSNYWEYWSWRYALHSLYQTRTMSPLTIFSFFFPFWETKSKFEREEKPSRIVSLGRMWLSQAIMEFHNRLTKSQAAQAHNARIWSIWRCCVTTVWIQRGLNGNAPLLLEKSIIVIFVNKIYLGDPISLNVRI